VIQLYSDDYTLSYWANRVSAAIKERARSYTTPSAAAKEAETRGRTSSGSASGATREFTTGPSVDPATRAGN
jgi:hypothetical protein